MIEKISTQYIAGFFDGEGCIGLYKRKDRYNGASLRIQLTQNKTNESHFILSYLKERYGGNISEQKTLSGGIKYNWQLSAKRIPIFLKDILPYLILKKYQGLLALYWLKNKPKIKRDGHGRVIKFSENEIKFTIKIIELMKDLKHKNIQALTDNQKDLVKIIVELTPLAVVKG